MMLPQAKPARKVKPNRRSVTGIYLTRRGEPLEFESQLERDAYLVLNYEPGVESVFAQPMLIQNRWPDCLISTENDEIFAEIKPEAEILERWSELSVRFSEMRGWCVDHGYGFGVITDINVNRPEGHRVDILKRIEFIGKTSDQARAGALKNQIDEVIQANGPSTFRSLAHRISSQADPVSAIRAACSLLAMGTRYAVATPSPKLLDCVVSFSETHEADLFTNRLMSLETLKERLRTHPCSRVSGGVTIVP